MSLHVTSPHPPTSSTQAANGEVRHHAGHACITHTRSLEKPQAHPGRGPTDDAYRKRTVALSEAKAVRVRVTVRVRAVSHRELFTFTTQSPLAAVVFPEPQKQSVYCNGKRFALCATNVSPQRVRGDSGGKLLLNKYLKK